MKRTLKQRLTVLAVGIIVFIWLFPLWLFGYGRPGVLSWYFLLGWFGSIIGIVGGVLWKPKYESAYCARCGRETSHLESLLTKKHRTESICLVCGEKTPTRLSEGLATCPNCKQATYKILRTGAMATEMYDEAQCQKCGSLFVSHRAGTFIMPRCELCSGAMTLIDLDSHKWYCYKDDRVSHT
jgi:ribosomal protein L37AE/L43A